MMRRRRQPNGSSPRVRGTLDAKRCDSSRIRFIPASAGNAHRAAPSAPSEPVHPRECGERPNSLLGIGEVVGSSPRVRGTRGDAMPALAQNRFIPASAGNACRVASLDPAISVHPRECGERAGSPPMLADQDGSSPRVRGTLGENIFPGMGGRFIPASAGNAPHPDPPAATTPVHPRECGERNSSTPCGRPPFGSSPRVRGTRRRPVSAQDGVRFIPASAGNAPGPFDLPPVEPVHPRECGERGQPSPRRPRRPGSSPRVRGTRTAQTDKARQGRFIPASAGNAP